MASRTRRRCFRVFCCFNTNSLHDIPAKQMNTKSGFGPDARLPQMSGIALRLKGAGFSPATVSAMWRLDQARARLAPRFRRKPTILPRRMSKSSRSWGWNQCRFTHFLLGFALVSAGAGSLASCSSMAQLPVSAGGMPQDAPKRPQIAPAFPAVHDMPPPRKSAVLTEEEKKRVEAELAVVRAQQARRAQSSKSDPN